MTTSPSEEGMRSQVERHAADSHPFVGRAISLRCVVVLACRHEVPRPVGRAQFRPAQGHDVIPGVLRQRAAYVSAAAIVGKQDGRLLGFSGHTGGLIEPSAAGVPVSTESLRVVCPVDSETSVLSGVASGPRRRRLGRCVATHLAGAGVAHGSMTVAEEGRQWLDRPAHRAPLALDTSVHHDLRSPRPDQRVPMSLPPSVVHVAPRPSQDNRVASCDRADSPTANAFRHNGPFRYKSIVIPGCDRMRSDLTDA